MANPKKMSIIDEKTTDTSLVLLLESQQKLDVPTRGCKALSRELALTKEFSDVLAGGGPNGKLFVGRGWCEIPVSEGTKELDGPEIMKVLTRMLMRHNVKDKKIIAQVGKILVDSECAREE